MKHYVKQLNQPSAPLLTSSLLALGVVVLYALLCVPLYQIFGPGAVAFVYVPALALAWLLGVRWGLIGALGLMELTRRLLSAGAVGPVEGLLAERLPGAICLLLLVGAAGALRDHLSLLRERTALEQRRRALLEEQLAAAQALSQELGSQLGSERVAALQRTQSLQEQLAAQRFLAQEYGHELRALWSSTLQRSEDHLAALRQAQSLEAQLLDERARATSIVPICAACKKIDDGHGCWSAPEAYLHERLGLRFSHGVCPDCTRDLYPQLYAADAGLAPEDVAGRVLQKLSEKSHRGELIASALCAWMFRHEAGLPSLAGLLGCSLEALVPLGACLRPQGAHRADDLELIAACVDADAVALERLLDEDGATRDEGRGARNFNHRDTERTEDN